MGKDEASQERTASNSSAYRVRISGWVWLIQGPGDDIGALMGLSAGARLSLQQEEVFRTSLTAGIDISAQRGGLVVFDFSGWQRGVVANDGFDEQVRAQSQRVRVANPHLLCLHSSYLKADPSLAVDTYRIAPRDLLGPGGGGHGAAVSKVFTGLNPLEFMAPFVVPEAVLIDSFEALNAILLHDFDFALDLVALLHYALVAYQEHDYPLTTVLAWTVCEALLNARWKSYLDERRQRKEDGQPTIAINHDRLKFLTSSEITASIMSEMLELAGELSLDLYNAIKPARSARNKWLHDLKEPSGKGAAQALQAAQFFIDDFFGFDLQLSTGRKITG